MFLSNFNQLMENSVKLEKSSLEHAFCSKDETLFFVHHGNMYIFPWTKSALQILENEGFVRTQMHNTDIGFNRIPLEMQKKWQELRQE